MNKYYPRDMTFEVIVSTCNPEVAKHFLGIWMPVLRKMLLMLASQKKVKSAAIINNLLQYSTAIDSKFELIHYFRGFNHRGALRPRGR